VEQGPRDEGDVVRRFVHLVRKLARDLQRHVQAGQHGSMRQDDGFRLARRARSENDEGRFFLIL
jgi:hypothetical protein